MSHQGSDNERTRFCFNIQSTSFMCVCSRDEIESNIFCVSLSLLHCTAYKISILLVGQKCPTAPKVIMCVKWNAGKKRRAHKNNYLHIIIFIIIIKTWPNILLKSTHTQTFFLMSLQKKNVYPLFHHTHQFCSWMIE